MSIINEVPGWRYPWFGWDRIEATALNQAFELSPGSTPPMNNNPNAPKSAGKFKYWVDTTDATFPSLRQCIVDTSTLGVYVAAEWLTLGVYDLPNGAFHFNGAKVDFSQLVVLSDLWVGGGLTVVGTTSFDTLSVPTLNVSGTATIASLNVITAADVAALFIDHKSAMDFDASGNGMVIGNGTAPALSLYPGASRYTNNNHEFKSTDGSTLLFQITTTGITAYVPFAFSSPITGPVTLSTLTVTGASALSSLSVTGSATVGGNVGVSGTLTGSVIASSSTISGVDIIASGNITTATGTISGADLNVTNDINAADTINAAQYHMRGIPLAAMDTGATQTVFYDPTGNPSITMYGASNYYANDTHYLTDSGSTIYAYFNATGAYNLVGSWNVVSDESLKENIVPYEAGLDAIRQLNPVSFNYVDRLRMARAAGTVNYGLMASEVLPVLPEMVGSTDFGMEGIPDPVTTLNPGHLTWVLINAVKELDAKLDMAFAGVIDGSEAQLGDVGEYQVVSNTVGVESASDMPTQVCALSLTPGDWEVWGSVDFTPPSNVSPNMIAASVSVHPDALPDEDDLMTGVGILNMFTTTALTSGQRQVLMTGQCRSNSAAPLDLYLVSQVSFSGGATVLAKGYICARRVR